ncbi:hypothetical protein CPB83DRAFT_857167 [Crepidotus variabilis]|uniref:Uncharacterized protein n=1 Tax=Crepidotus variabilis TaxID=179855 RepID=A0A9P6ED52_9AGAR|nr:hypothetical protein CPB83DRAFT_857167 [Crepidotus variabilis]
MKFSNAMSLSLLSLLAAPALGCLETIGSIDVQGNVDTSITRVIDNGLVVCNAAWGWRVDQDNHVSLNCLANYIYAVTKDGATAWYRNPVNAFSFTQSVSAGGSSFWWDDHHFC